MYDMGALQSAEPSLKPGLILGPVGAYSELFLRLIGSTHFMAFCDTTPD